MKSTSKHKKRKLSKTGRILLDVLLVICLCIAGYSGYKLVSEMNDYKQAEKTYTTIREKIVTEPKEQVSDDSLQIDWNTLYETNAGSQGWLYQKDTPINYPIVQGTDNEFYLTHALDGSYSIFGCLFIDYRNNPGFTDKNTVIYGHHIYELNDSMFTTLEKYMDQSYYDTHKELDLYLPDGRYKLYPISGTVRSGYDDYIRTTFADDDDYYDYIASFFGDSTFTSDQTFERTDTTVMFSTCTNKIEEGRYVVICKMVKA